MTLYLDSARPDDARRAAALGYVGGITTNPKLLAATGCPLEESVAALLAILPGPLFFQPLCDDYDCMRRQTFQLRNVDPSHLIAKLPCTRDGLRLVADIHRDVRCGVTAVYSPAQALAAVEAGAAFILPYFSRMMRHLPDARGTLGAMRAVIDRAGTGCRLVVASVKTPDEVVEALLAGGHDITAPIEVLEGLSQHELTTTAMKEFMEAAATLRPRPHA